MFFSQIFAAVLCLSNTAFALPGTGVLQPINVLAFEAAVGLHRRDTTRFTDLTPTEQAQLVYGSAAENGNLLLANMTLTAPSGLLIVMLERLEGLTSAVDCYGDDGELSVTWVDQEAYSSALASWSWVNEDLEAQFLVIVNHEGCGPVGERSAYRITDVDTDEAALKTKLTAVGVAWKEVTGTFSMDFGKMALKRVQRRGLEERGWSDFWNGVKEAAGKTADVAEKAGDALKDTAEKVGDAVKGAVGDVAEDVKDAAKELAKTVGDVFEQVGDADLAEELEFVVSAGQEGVKKNIFTEPFTR